MIIARIMMEEDKKNLYFSKILTNLLFLEKNDKIKESWQSLKYNS